MYKKFSTFEELVNDFMTRDGIAVRYADSSRNICEISYPELGRMIISEMHHVKAENSSVEVIYEDRTPDTIVNIFAHVMAGCDIIIAGPLAPESFTLSAAKKAEAAKAARESRRDSWGRIVGARGEGEILFFTSGTTSSSKIVRLTSESLCACAWGGQSMLACGKDDVVLSILPMSHVFGFVCSMLWGLAYGATVAIGRGTRHITEDPMLFRPTILPAVPSLMNVMLTLGALNPELKVALIGAAPCPRAVTDALNKKGIKVYFGYGLTETSSGIAISQDTDEPDALYPCPDADIHIEEDGEVTVAVPYMMQGYIGDEPMFKEDRFFTGDLGWFDDKGRLHLRGRKKDVLVMADGTKIFCPEYEEFLSDRTGLSELAVTLKKDRAVLVAGSCSDDPAIAADIKNSLQEAVSELNDGLARSQQIYDVIVRSEALPRTPAGKLKRYELYDQMN